MTVRELREKYLKFFESKGHMVHSSGSLIPYDVTGRLDESLLFNGAGMVQFKPYFRGAAEPKNKRMVTAQKCVRTGDIESVGDLSHLTFFEMMGNFSFGDYFKAHAISFAWEFLTSKEWLGLDPARLCCTIFEEDDEAETEWDTYWRSAGFDPNGKTFRLGEDTNYWPANSFTHGPPGPCGPNSEIFYWTDKNSPPSSDYSKEDFLRDEAAGKWLEIWNLVFIQFEWQGHLKNPQRPQEGYQKDAMPPLPFQSIDTGLGLERTSAVLSGRESVYDTDAFGSIIRKIEEIAESQGDVLHYGKDETKDTAMRIIADHIRTACFCIADGILPSNNGRGYVLRRLIRRAVLKGQRVLGFEKPFFHEVFEGALEAMGSHYKELSERKDVIFQTLYNEELLFRRTLKEGMARLETSLDESRDASNNMLLDKSLKPVKPLTLIGSRAFELYDTFGFPLEVTIEVCEEHGWKVDLDGYEAALEAAQLRSKSASGMDTVYGGVNEANQLVAKDAPQQTEFVGYDQLEAPGTIVRIRPVFDDQGKMTDRLMIALDQTPFYAESGGQVGDVGLIKVGIQMHLEVENTIKSSGVFWHECPSRTWQGMSRDEVMKLLEVELLGKQVEAVVDGSPRARTKRNHTATHLLHAALRQVLGKHVTQAGSYVGPDHLRFDFTHGKAMTPNELHNVEGKVNREALANTGVETHVDIPIEEAKARGAMALFGEKYGDKVRMVEIGEFSRELCGGTHVRSTGEIGLFKILSESSAASGVRRIEAVTGEAAYEWALEENRRIREAAALLKASPKDLVHAVERSIESQKELNKRLEKLRTQSATSESAKTSQVGPIELAVQKITDGEAKEASMVADRLAENAPNRVVLVALSSEGKIMFVCKVGNEAGSKGAHAGNLVREIAKITGGGGGGRPDFATAGGKDPSKVDEALEAAEKILSGFVTGD